MFDPTIYENLKVVIEGAIYELDLNGSLSVIDRIDNINLAKMNRKFGLTFMKKEGSVKAHLSLNADTNTLASEILEKDTASLGCQLEITFYVKVGQPKTDCESILFLINKHWRKYRPTVTQQLSYIYGEDEGEFLNAINIVLNDPINESHIDEIKDILAAVIDTLTSLENDFNPKRK
ncbi:hypothetical protein JOD45_003052 [Scopulibacillus daqui]|uniref:Uncharacterized protein n=1 Tax=Scopulibacillus daqui TaxID=1469162 RepID=A0ABS2Q3E5_9BACL|nr:hypothetical protein [Scopulibacillus daqui]MBM7646818.1 hypothetical protein [Scopulibacillus daqui]